jgi:hypothetical protein
MCRRRGPETGERTGEVNAVSGQGVTVAETFLRLASSAFFVSFVLKP